VTIMDTHKSELGRRTLCNSCHRKSSIPRFFGRRGLNRLSEYQRKGARWGDGFTLLELLVTITIVGVLAGLAVPLYVSHLDKAKVARAIAEIRYIEKTIDSHETTYGTLPNTLSEIGAGGLVDPWGKPYEYFNLSAGNQPRKDRFLVPINSDYDLYSKGKNGESVQPLTAPQSLDDIVRASNGTFVGLASEF
jgi:general secretion pathway protein G